MIGRKRKNKAKEAEASDSEAAPASSVTHEEIALCAYHIWKAEGCAEGRAIDHWLQAELQLRAERALDNPQRLEAQADQHQDNATKT